MCDPNIWPLPSARRNFADTQAPAPPLSPLDRSVLVYADPMYKGRERPIARLLPELEPEPARRVGGLVTLLPVNPRCRSTSEHDGIVVSLWLPTALN